MAVTCLQELWIDGMMMVQAQKFRSPLLKIMQAVGNILHENSVLLMSGEKMAQVGLKEEDVKKEKGNHQCWSSIY